MADKESQHSDMLPGTAANRRGHTDVLTEGVAWGLNEERVKLPDAQHGIYIYNRIQNNKPSSPPFSYSAHNSQQPILINMQASYTNKTRT